MEQDISTIGKVFSAGTGNLVFSLKRDVRELLGIKVGDYLKITINGVIKNDNYVPRKQRNNNPELKEEVKVIDSKEIKRKININ